MDLLLAIRDWEICHTKRKKQSFHAFRFIFSSNSTLLCTIGNSRSPEQTAIIVNINVLRREAFPIKAFENYNGNERKSIDIK